MNLGEEQVLKNVKCGLIANGLEIGIKKCENGNERAGVKEKKWKNIRKKKPPTRKSRSKEKNKRIKKERKKE